MNRYSKKVKRFFNLFLIFFRGAKNPPKNRRKPALFIFGPRQIFFTFFVKLCSKPIRTNKHHLSSRRRPGPRPSAAIVRHPGEGRDPGRAQQGLASQTIVHHYPCGASLRRCRKLDPALPRDDDSLELLLKWRKTDSKEQTPPVIPAKAGTQAERSEDLRRRQLFIIIPAGQVFAFAKTGHRASAV